MMAFLDRIKGFASFAFKMRSEKIVIRLRKNAGVHVRSYVFLRFEGTFSNVAAKYPSDFLSSNCFI